MLHSHGIQRLAQATEYSRCGVDERSVEIEDDGGPVRQTPTFGFHHCPDGTVICVDHLEVVRLDFTLTRKEVFRANHRSLREFDFVLLIVVPALLVLGFLGPAGNLLFFAAIVLVLLAVAVLLHFLNPRYAWKRSSDLRGPQQLIATKERVTSVTERTSSTVMWSCFDSRLESKDQFLLTVANQLSVIVPKRAFSNVQQQQAFRELSRVISSGSNAGRQRTTWLGLALILVLLVALGTTTVLFPASSEDTRDDVAIPERTDLLTLEDLQADPVNQLLPPQSMLTYAMGYKRCAEDNPGPPAFYRSYRTSMDNPALLQFFETNLQQNGWTRVTTSPESEVSEEADFPAFTKQAPKGSLLFEVDMERAAPTDFMLILSADDADDVARCPAEFGVE